FGFRVISTTRASRNSVAIRNASAGEPGAAGRRCGSWFALLPGDGVEESSMPSPRRSSTSRWLRLYRAGSLLRAASEIAPLLHKEIGKPEMRPAVCHGPPGRATVHPARKRPPARNLFDESSSQSSPILLNGQDFCES